MAVNFQYHYAIVDKTMGYLCLEVCTTSVNNDGHENDIELYISIDVYSDDYIMKYYDPSTGKWYYDESHLNEWIPPVA